MTRPREHTTEPAVHQIAWDARDTLLDVLRAHPVVHIRTPGWHPEAYVQFAAQMGTVEPVLRENFRHPDEPRIMLIGNVRDPAGREASGSAIDFGWHSDMSWRAHPPALTFLYGDAIPPSGGGNTLFSNLYRVHDHLDAATRAAWEALDIVHESSSRYFENRDDRKTLRPLIQPHAISGRPLVFASPAHTPRVQGLRRDASDAVLARVKAALDPPDRVHRWQAGDLIVWDNRAVVHCATTFDHRELRRLWRVSVHPHIQTESRKHEDRA